ncbi:MAG: phosphoribosylglycinamide formyltransferase [Firmicutes bacterium]|nr:phosphoribosylglycinamide formyltransferase [Bacillota bacterium]
MLRCAILVSGRGSNMEAILKAKASGDLPIEVAVVATDRPGAPAITIARRYGVNTFEPSPEQAGDKRTFFSILTQKLQELDVDLIVLAGFMRILPPDFLARYPERIINIHPSLLPAFPGLKAQRQALEYGVRFTGCTVHFVDEGVDSGPIIDQRVVPVYPDDTEESLAARILVEEHRLLPACIRLFAEGRLRIEGRRVRILPPTETR